MFRTRVRKRLELLKQLSLITKGDYRFFTPIVAQKIRDDIISNILEQKTPGGGRLKRNKKATRDYKLRKFGDDRSLIWFRVLIDPSTWLAKGYRKKATLRLRAKRREIGDILEAKGYRFFGISMKVRKEILEEFMKKVRLAFRRAGVRIPR